MFDMTDDRDRERGLAWLESAPCEDFDGEEDSIPEAFASDDAEDRRAAEAEEARRADMSFFEILDRG
ncbi:MAG: hypothetical protein U9Q72_00440 [Patescibacteria group bacterium]|nr:hypothetical protein [Patescibacteria group bacterium]